MSRIVGPVGDDFDDEHLELLRERGVDVYDVERVEGGETFLWAGHYEADMNLAHTDDTQLGVFADFEPKLSEASQPPTCCSWAISSRTCSAGCARSAKAPAWLPSTR